MLNKKDPLISAVQKVMENNHTEREAAKIVNEKFGVVDRRALPHEQQANWEAEYSKVITENSQSLNEAVSPAQYSEKQKKLAAIAGNKKKIDGPDLTAARAGKASHIEEEQIDEREVNPYAVGMAAVKKQTGDTPPMEKKNIIKAHEIAKKIKAKMEEAYDRLNEAGGPSMVYMKAKQAAAAKSAASTASSSAARGVNPMNAPSTGSNMGMINRGLMRLKTANLAPGGNVRGAGTVAPQPAKQAAAAPVNDPRTSNALAAKARETAVSQTSKMSGGGTMGTKPAPASVPVPNIKPAAGSVVKPAAGPVVKPVAKPNAPAFKGNWKGAAPTPMQAGKKSSEGFGNLRPGDSGRNK